MIDKTRIFISSAYESDLISPRKMIKEHLENTGHEVPIFENGDFGSWEKDTLNQCIEVVKSSDVVIILIHKKASAQGDLMSGNITPTFLEYRAAIKKNKHILVFVTPEIKNSFMQIRPQLEILYKKYIQESNRLPDSPMDPFIDWFQTRDVITKLIIEKADKFVWAFLYEIYRNRNWINELDISRTSEQTLVISQMLSTSLKKVVKFIPQYKEIEESNEHLSYLMKFTEQNLKLINKRNTLGNNSEKWSNFLEEMIKFLETSFPIIQAPEVNPTEVNKISMCYAASLYEYKEERLCLIGSTSRITAPESFHIDENDVYVVDSYKKNARLITFREDKQMIYITENISGRVLCLHFPISLHWDSSKVKAYVDEIEYAILIKNDMYFDLIKALLGGRV